MADAMQYAHSMPDPLTRTRGAADLPAVTRRKMMMGLPVACLATAILADGALEAHAQASPDALWQALKDARAVALMRHARAPGVGDPANFDVNNCATQRNLDDTGRQQAANTGELFRSNGIATASVFTSAWCRCQETATGLKLGDPVVLPALNSFFRRGTAQRDDHTAQLKAWLRDQIPDGPVVLVTHQVNISALTGNFAASGEMVVIDRDVSGGIKVLGSIPAR